MNIVAKVQKIGIDGTTKQDRFTDKEGNNRLGVRITANYNMTDYSGKVKGVLIHNTASNDVPDRNTIPTEQGKNDFNKESGDKVGNRWRKNKHNILWKPEKLHLLVKR